MWGQQCYEKHMELRKQTVTFTIAVCFFGEFGRARRGLPVRTFQFLLFAFASRDQQLEKVCQESYGIALITSDDDLVCKDFDYARLMAAEASISVPSDPQKKFFGSNVRKAPGHPRIIAF